MADATPKNSEQGRMPDDELLAGLKAALPNPFIPPDQLAARRKKRKVNTLIVTSVSIGISVLASGLSASLIGAFRSQVPQENQEVAQARAQFWGARDQYVEYLSRYDRDPRILGKVAQPGAYQQLLALDAQEKREAIQAQVANPNHIAYRKHPSVAYALAEVNWNEVLHLAALGNGAILEYQNGAGKKVRVPVSPPMAGALASSNLLSLDMAQNLEQLPNYDQNYILTKVGRLQFDKRLTQASYIASQGLTDVPTDLKAIESFKSLNAPQLEKE